MQFRSFVFASALLVSGNLAAVVIVLKFLLLKKQITSKTWIKSKL
jgi:hypothetical protein